MRGRVSICLGGSALCHFICHWVKRNYWRRQPVEQFDRRSEVHGAQVRASQRHGEGLVPQHVLDLFERPPTLRKMRAAGVPKIMEAEVGEGGPGDSSRKCCSDLAPVFPIGPFEDAPLRLSGSGSTLTKAASACLFKGTPRASPFFVS